MFNLIGAIVSGLFVGAFARFLYPGAVPMGWGMTILLGVGGSLLASLVTTRGQIDGWLQVLLREELIEKGGATRFAGQTEYRFSQAMMREAAYDLLTEEDRRKGHGIVASALISTDSQCAEIVGTNPQQTLITLLGSPGGKAALSLHGALFDIVYHLNRSISSNQTAPSMVPLIEVNLMAAQRADAANAVDTALKYVTSAQRFLYEPLWASHFDLCFELCTRAGEYAYFAGDTERSHREFLAVEERVCNFDQLTQYMTLRVSQAEMLGIPPTTLASRMKTLGIEHRGRRGRAVRQPHHRAPSA